MNRYETAISEILKRLKSDLAPTLFYHGLFHTEDVIDAARTIGLSEGLNEDDLNLLLLAAAYHDSGHLVAYHNHEETGCGIAYFMLSNLGFSMEEIKKICQMIMATKVPQKPKSKLDQILCDADLDYLGREDYGEISHELYKEFCEWGILCGEKTWTERQISFLTEHKFWTDYAILNRDFKKQQQPDALKVKLNSL